MTTKLYYDNPYQQNFSAQVIGHTTFKGQPAILLDQTAFYPTSGGQPHDTGTLNGVPVIDVFEDEQQQIVHVLAQVLDTDRVEGKIDWTRRFDHIQQHTGQHLLSQAVLQVCGAETVSFHLGEDLSTIDVNQAEINAVALTAVENLANQVIYDNRHVIAHVVSQEEVQQFPVRKWPTVEDRIRIIEIRNFDYSPCGGTHCARTGEIGVITIKKWEHNKGGTRMHFVCGWRALRDYQQKTIIVRNLSKAFSTGEAELVQIVTKLQDEHKTLRRSQELLNQQLLAYEAQSLLAERERHGELSVLRKIFVDRAPKDLKFLANNVLERAPETVILFGSKAEGAASLFFLRSAASAGDMHHLMQTACGIMNGRGGGQPHQAQGGGTAVEKLENALECAVAMLVKVSDRSDRSDTL